MCPQQEKASRIGRLLYTRSAVGGFRCESSAITQVCIQSKSDNHLPLSLAIAAFLFGSTTLPPQQDFRPDDSMKIHAGRLCMAPTSAPAYADRCVRCARGSVCTLSVHYRKRALSFGENSFSIRDQGFETVTGSGKPIERGFYNASFRSVLKSVLKSINNYF